MPPKLPVIVGCCCRYHQTYCLSRTHTSDPKSTRRASAIAILSPATTILFAASAGPSPDQARPVSSRLVSRYVTVVTTD